MDVSKSGDPFAPDDASGDEIAARNFVKGEDGLVDENWGDPQAARDRVGGDPLLQEPSTARAAREAGLSRDDTVGGPDGHGAHRDAANEPSAGHGAAEAEYQEMTNGVLRDLIEERGMPAAPVSWTKRQLIDVLVENDQASEDAEVALEDRTDDELLDIAEAHGIELDRDAPDLDREALIAELRAAHDDENEEGEEHGVSE